MVSEAIVPVADEADVTTSDAAKAISLPDAFTPVHCVWIYFKIFVVASQATTIPYAPLVPPVIASSITNVPGVPLNVIDFNAFLVEAVATTAVP